MNLTNMFGSVEALALKLAAAPMDDDGTRTITLPAREFANVSVALGFACGVLAIVNAECARESNPPTAPRNRG